MNENSSSNEVQQLPSLDNPGCKIEIARTYDEPFFWGYDFSSLDNKKEKYQKIASDLNSIIPVLSDLGIRSKENVLLYAETSRSENKEVELKNLKNTFIAEAASLLEGTSTTNIVVSTLQFKDIVDRIDCNICIPEFNEDIVSWNGSSFVVNEEPIKKECEVWVEGRDLETWNLVVELFQTINKITEKEIVKNLRPMLEHIPILASSGIIKPTTRNMTIILNRYPTTKIQKW